VAQKAKGGRPTKLTDARVKAIVESIELGLTQEDAAIGARIGESTLRAWKAKGKAKRQEIVDRVGEDDPEKLLRALDRARKSDPFLAFLAAVQEAEKDGLKSCLATVHECRLQAEPAVRLRAAIWLLENRYGYRAPDKLEAKITPHESDFEIADYLKSDRAIELGIELVEVIANGG
jgi:hypothetical protein